MKNLGHYFPYTVLLRDRLRRANERCRELQEQNRFLTGVVFEENAEIHRLRVLLNDVDLAVLRKHSQFCGDGLCELCAAGQRVNNALRES
jgi:hypothetical protein